jgi:uncharacterized Tic20 family protein
MHLFSLSFDIDIFSAYSALLFAFNTLCVVWAPLVLFSSYRLSFSVLKFIAKYSASFMISALIMSLLLVHLHLLMEEEILVVQKMRERRYFVYHLA